MDFETAFILTTLEIIPHKRRYTGIFFTPSSHTCSHEGAQLSATLKLFITAQI